MRKTPYERLMLRTKVDDCWTVFGKLNPDGYARLRANGLILLVHRWSYEEFVGPIPSGYVIDHLCRNRACWNPAHLEAVTQRVNVFRASPNLLENLCVNGHEFTAENTYTNPTTGYRDCRVCQADRKRKWAKVNRG